MDDTRRKPATGYCVFLLSPHVTACERSRRVIRARQAWSLRANISETVLVLLINEQGEKEKGRDEREFSWFCFFWKLGCHGTERRRAWRAEAEWSGSPSGRRFAAGLAA